MREINELRHSMSIAYQIKTTRKEPVAMNTTLVAAIVAGSLFAAVWLGRAIRRFLPEHHLTADSRDVVKLAMGLVATMAALLLGLLVSSAKGSYDTERSEVGQMAAKVALLDRTLTLYGPEAAPVRAQFRAALEGAVRRLWPVEKAPPQLEPETQLGDAVFLTLQSLSPQNDTQRSLKTQATSLALELAQLRTLLLAQSVSSISEPLLVVVVAWLVVIFLSFSLLAPPNATATLALMVSALSVSGAIFLILELDQPFGGLIRISSEPMLKVLSQLAEGTP